MENILNVDIIEVTGHQVEEQIRSLAAFEKKAAGCVAKGEFGFMGHAVVSPGIPSTAIQNLSAVDTKEVRFACASNDPSNEIAVSFRGFCAKQFALVEEHLQVRLRRLYDELDISERELVCFHFIMTMKRYPCRKEMLADQPIHADSFDGTICSFALMSTKMGTPIYPAGLFSVAPLDQFVQESFGGFGGFECRPPEIRLQTNAASNRPISNALRPWRDGSLVILPAAVPHSIPNGYVHDFQSSSHAGEMFASFDDPRWFTRVTLEIVHKDGVDFGKNPFGQWQNGWPTVTSPTGQVYSPLRLKVSYLVAKHVWNNENFASMARKRWSDMGYSFP